MRGESTDVQPSETRVAPDENGRSVLLDVSNAVVRIHKQYFGKGPTKARSHLSHDLLTVVLEGGFTRAEETLLEHGYEHEVAQSRVAMQHSAEHELRGAVEEILQRPVRSFMSANDPGTGLQVEVFVLDTVEPAAVEPAMLAERARNARAQHRRVLEEHRALRAEQVQSRRAHQPRETDS